MTHRRHGCIGWLRNNILYTITDIFDICGSVHHHLVNKTTNVMRLGAIVFIIPWKALYMFRVLFTPIVRSVLKLYMQLLVQSLIGMVSDPVCYKMIRSVHLYAPDF
jgi:hypothetical protein